MTQANILKAYQAYLEGLDAIIMRAPKEDQGTLEAELLSRENQPFYVFLSGVLAQMASYSRGLSSDALTALGHEFSSHFRPTDSTYIHAPFGSYDIGEGLFKKLIDLHPWKVSAIDQARLRRRSIVDELRTALSTPGKMRLLSLGCSYCDELVDIFDSAESFQRLEVVMVDEHLPTVQKAQSKMAEVAEMAGLTPNVSFVRKSIASFSRPESLARMGTFDFVYSMGLFEYLTHDVARALTKGLTSLLKPGAILIIGNHWAEHHHAINGERWIDWHLVHRTEEDLLRLANEHLQAEVKTVSTASTKHLILKASKVA